MPNLSWVTEIINRFTLKALIKEILEKGLATHSCLENSIERGAWQATVHGVTNSWTQKIREESRVGKAKKSVQKHIQLLCWGSWQGLLWTALLATSLVSTSPQANGYFCPTFNGRVVPLSVVSSLCLQGKSWLVCHWQSLLAASGLGGAIRLAHPGTPTQLHCCNGNRLWSPLVSVKHMQGVFPHFSPLRGARQSSQWGLQHFPLPDRIQHGPPVSEACPQPSMFLRTRGIPTTISLVRPGNVSFNVMLQKLHLNYKNLYVNNQVPVFIISEAFILLYKITSQDTKLKFDNCRFSICSLTYIFHTGFILFSKR